MFPYSKIYILGDSMQLQGVNNSETEAEDLPVLKDYYD